MAKKSKATKRATARARQGRPRRVPRRRRSSRGARRLSHRHAVPDRERWRRRAGVLQAGARRARGDADGRRRAARSATPRSASATRTSCSATSFRARAPRRRPRWAAPPARSCSTCRTSMPRSRRPSTRAASRSWRPADMFWGDRFGKLEDPYGNQWAHGDAQGGRAAQADGRAGQGRDGGDGPGAGQRLMRDVHVSAITDAVKKLCMEANVSLEPDVLRAFDRALGTERSPAGKQVLQILKDNAELARTPAHPVLPGHRHGRLLRRAGPGRARDGRRAGGRHQRGRAPGLHGRLPARVDRASRRSTA